MHLYLANRRGEDFLEHNNFKGKMVGNAVLKIAGILIKFGGNVKNNDWKRNANCRKCSFPVNLAVVAIIKELFCYVANLCYKDKYKLQQVCAVSNLGIRVCNTVMSSV